MDKIQENSVHLRAIITESISEAHRENKITNLPVHVQHKLDKLINDFSEVFSKKPGKIRDYWCTIRIRDNKPINQRPYLIPMAKKDAVKKKIERMIELDIIDRLPYCLTSLKKKKTVRLDYV
jgi:hypothetical protein